MNYDRHYKLLFPSNYVGAHDLKGKDVTLTIEAVAIEELTMAGGKTENKPIVRFKGASKALVLNKTNAKSIAKQHGKTTDDWIGKQITLYPTTTKCGRETVDCIRIREGE